MKLFISRIAMVCMLAAGTGAFPANSLISEETGELLAALVRASLEYDLYNARCRGNAASTKTEDSNRLFLSKYRLTVNQVISLYIGKDDRAERAAMEQGFLQKLSLLGGCDMAKKKKLKKELDETYRRLSEQISSLP
ncbi:MAG: hypothetical protein KDI43_17040 [Gammaproteobacteria bacterium]|nr:hypothetical protein [Gammaproteobacteria bacterium]MCP5444053.1 hypothetical protein [Chromatiaceae bacterium]